MKQYDRIIINRLLDSYEASSLYKGTNRVNVSIALKISRKSFPEYFSETSGAYEEIHIAADRLQKSDLVNIVWKGKYQDNIIDKIVLNTDNIPDAYSYVNRKGKDTLTENAIKIIESEVPETDCGTPVTIAFARYLVERLQEGKSIKEYGDIRDPEDLKRLIRVIREIEFRNSGTIERERDDSETAPRVKRNRGIYLREFSISLLGDSKAVEAMKGRITAAFRRFGEAADFEDIMAEYGIYTTPNYVYIKGRGKINAAGNVIDLENMVQGVGLSGEDISEFRLEDTAGIDRIITVENLTSFFRFSEIGCLVIYLGGYHNSIRRSMLKKISAQLLDVEYLHFGDIDAGGFEILFDLRRKTRLDFRPYFMDQDTLKEYSTYGKTLTTGDKKRLEVFKEKILNGDPGYEIDRAVSAQITACIDYMLAENIKLEQECVLLSGLV